LTSVENVDTLKVKLTARVFAERREVGREVAREVERLSVAAREVGRKVGRLAVIGSLSHPGSIPDAGIPNHKRIPRVTGEYDPSTPELRGRGRI